MAYTGFDISNKVILITGGTSGIGREIALGCAMAGAKVVAGSTNPAFEWKAPLSTTTPRSTELAPVAAATPAATGDNAARPLSLRDK